MPRKHQIDPRDRFNESDIAVGFRIHERGECLKGEIESVDYENQEATIHWLGTPDPKNPESVSIWAIEEIFRRCDVDLPLE